MRVTLFIFLLTYSSIAMAAKKVAIVKLLRGEVNILSLGKTDKLKVNDWVEEGSLIRTAEKSFAKLIFIDKSQMNIGPGSEVKIEKFDGKDSGVIDLVKGKVRSQVSKDYLQIQQDKSKLFIKTSSAVMGVRGTDFILSTNGKSTSAILFEGEIAFNKLGGEKPRNNSGLEHIVNRGVRMYPGEFSVVDKFDSFPTVPALLNVHQRERLEKSATFTSTRAPASVKKVAGKLSIVPPGLNGKLVSNSAQSLKKVMVQTRAPASQVRSPASSNPNGYIKGNLLKPANGSFLHVDSGVIIPPGPTSVYDGNSNTYLGTEGSVGMNGDFIPPSNIEINSDGTILQKSIDPNGELTVVAVEKPVPVMDTAPAENTVVASNDIINNVIAPDGLQDINNFERNRDGGLNSFGTFPQTRIGVTIRPVD
jgi:hypothetical protein